MTIGPWRRYTRGEIFEGSRLKLDRMPGSTVSTPNFQAGRLPMSSSLKVLPLLPPQWEVRLDKVDLKSTLNLLKSILDQRSLNPNPR
jgi:hypothetical protein